MAHHTVRTPYESLVARLNRLPQGAPPADTLYAILKLLFSEKEAELVALLPIRPFTAEHAARRWQMNLADTQKVLDGLADRAILLDMQGPDGQVSYVLPPPMAGFFEFSMMRLRGDVDQKLLAELFYQYINVEDDFITALFMSETRLGRAFVDEEALPQDRTLVVMDYERASEVVRSASHRSVGICYCRHKMMHMDRACDAPLDICMTFNNTGATLARHGYAREIDVAEGLDLLQEARDRGLVQFGENVQQGVNFICNCCGCCCEAMIAARQRGVYQRRTDHKLSAGGGREPLQRLRQVRHGLSGRGDGAGIDQRSAPSEAAQGARGYIALSWLRRLRARLHKGWAAAGGKAAARDHAGRLGPQDGADGDRARDAAEPDLRQPGAGKPPGDGGNPGRHLAPAAGQTGHGDRTSAQSLPGQAARLGEDEVHGGQYMTPGGSSCCRWLCRP